MKKNMPARFLGNCREEKLGFFKPRKSTASININDYKLKVGELKTEKDLERYKIELERVLDNKDYYLHVATDCLPQQLLFSFIATVSSMTVARVFTDKAWAAVLGAIVGVMTFAVIDWQYENADSRQDVRNCRKQIRFIKRAIREYELKKTQQSNAINNVAGNVK